MKGLYQQTTTTTRGVIISHNKEPAAAQRCLRGLGLLPPLDLASPQHAGFSPSCLLPHVDRRLHAGMWRNPMARASGFICAERSGTTRPVCLFDDAAVHGQGRKKRDWRPSRRGTGVTSVKGRCRLAPGLRDGGEGGHREMEDHLRSPQRLPFLLWSRTWAYGHPERQEG